MARKQVAGGSRAQAHARASAAARRTMSQEWARTRWDGGPHCFPSPVALPRSMAWALISRTRVRLVPINSRTLSLRPPS
eukprot:2476880-Pyramimonas_sp.AAC.1